MAHTKASKPRGFRLQQQNQNNMLFLVEKYHQDQVQLQTQTSAAGAGGVLAKGAGSSDLNLNNRDAILHFIKRNDTKFLFSRMSSVKLNDLVTNAIAEVRRGSEAGDQEDDSDSGQECDDRWPTMEVPAASMNSMNRSMLGVYRQHMPPPTPGSAPVPTTPSTQVPPPTNGSQGPSAEPELPPVEGKAPEAPTSYPATPAKRRHRDSSTTAEGTEAKKAKRAAAAIAAASEKWATPTTRLSDMAGIDGCIKDVLELVALPLMHPEIFLHFGAQPPRGILLHGPPGCGKTMLAHAIAGQAGVPFINISAPSIVAGTSGESELKLRELFDEAKKLAPCVVFIDEIDAIAPKRDTAHRQMESRIVTQLLTSFDDISMEKTDNKPVIVIGATNRPDALDVGLRRPGRFDREISIGVPDEKARTKILEKLCSKLKMSGDLDVAQLAKWTPGYVGADLAALTAEAGMSAVSRVVSTLYFTTPAESRSETAVAGTAVAAGIADGIAAMDIDAEHTIAPAAAVVPIPTAHPTLMAVDPTSSSVTVGSSVGDFLEACPAPLNSAELEPFRITAQDFAVALKKVQPSAKREGFATVPEVSWEDIGALEHVRAELRKNVVEPIQHGELFQGIGIGKAQGVLLYGPPGCGKTLLAKAVANESSCNFISVKGPELLNKYVGESEKAVRTVFARAQASSPCIVFFDEFDALCPSRSNEGESQSSSRLVNALLTEMDGVQDRRQVYVIAATNRPDMIDPAMLRSGRLGKPLYVDFPDPSERADILRAVTRRMPIGPTVSLAAVADDARCDGYSGADLHALSTEAVGAALWERVVENGGNYAGLRPENVIVAQRHFDLAFSKMKPSVNKDDRKRYRRLRDKFSATANAASVKPFDPPPEAPPGNETPDGAQLC
ncbi:hypothetical protein HDU89_005592 [Geranomyces variabilis]|nr:hypothetical protein HDU89_005592 [Geranomyces variabilis]